MNTGQMMSKGLTRPTFSARYDATVTLHEGQQESSTQFSDLLGCMQRGEALKTDPRKIKKSVSEVEDVGWKDASLKSIHQNSETTAAGQMILTPVQRQNSMNDVSTTVDDAQNGYLNEVPKGNLLTAEKTVEPASQEVEQQIEPVTVSGTPPVNDMPVSEEPAPEQSVNQSETPSSVKIQVASNAANNLLAMQALSEVEPELPAETEQLLNQQMIVEEMTSAMPSAVSAVETAFTSSDLLDSGSDQAASDQRFSSQMMGAQIHLQPKTDPNTASSEFVSEKRSRQEVSEQIAKQVKERLAQHELKAGNQQIKLTLSPENLGELKMNLNLQGQKLSVEIITESRMARDAIRLNADALKESLARQNITMESFDVTTGENGRGSENWGENLNAWQELANRQQEQFWTSNRGFQTAQTVIAPKAAYKKQPGYSMLDIHY